jgi:glycosyltransferase involved in cell wall biosynthesis
LKICFLSDAQSVHTARWARHFQDRGDEVTVVSFDPGEIEGVRVVVLPPLASCRPLNIILQLGRIRRLVRMLQPDILHAHYVTSYGLAGALCRQSPFIATAWGTDVLISPEESMIYRQLVRFVLRRADLITAMAPHMTEHLVQRGYALREKILTLPFGVDTKRFNPAQRTRMHTDLEPTVVSTRHLSAAMDVDTLIRAIPRVLEARPTVGVRFLIANDGPQRRALEALAARLGVSSFLSFIGTVGHEAMPAFLGSADLFVSTSPSDGNNISLNEAMACGAFPIASDIPANRNWLHDGENGLLYPCRDEKALADALVRALKRPEWRTAVMPENWEIIRTRASWIRSMERMERHYKAFLGIGKGIEKHDG